jgi:hypothetical protein
MIRAGWDEPPRDEHVAKVFQPIRHSWRVKVAHGHFVRRRPLARCFENTAASVTDRVTAHRFHHRSPSGALLRWS